MSQTCNSNSTNHHHNNTVSVHNFKLSVSNPKSKYVVYLSVLSQISNCQGLGRKNKHEILKTDHRQTTRQQEPNGYAIAQMSGCISGSTQYHVHKHPSTYMCIYIYIYIHINIYIYIYREREMCIYIYIYTYITSVYYTSIHVSMYPCIHRSIYLHRHAGA